MTDYHLIRSRAAHPIAQEKACIFLFGGWIVGSSRMLHDGGGLESSAGRIRRIPVSAVVFPAAFSRSI